MRLEARLGFYNECNALLLPLGVATNPTLWGDIRGIPMRADISIAGSKFRVHLKIKIEKYHDLLLYMYIAS